MTYLEIAQLLNLNPKYPTVLRRRHLGFPAPIARIHGVLQFKRQEIIDWATLAGYWDDTVGVPMRRSVRYDCPCCWTPDQRSYDLGYQAGVNASFDASPIVFEEAEAS